MDDALFVAAKSKAEAAARLYAVSGAAAPSPLLGPGSKERKSVLTATASRFSLDLDYGAPKDRLAEAILAALGCDWSPAYSSTGQTVTLAGLNAILQAAEVRARREAETRVRSLEPNLPSWFSPARDKLEAVRRISSVTGGRPQDLGPGSKERKSVLVDLTENLGLPIDTSLSKTQLAGAISRYLHQPWDDSCWSTGETITLKGLNAVLAGAESVALRGHPFAHNRLRQEAQLLVAALAAVCPPSWDGRESVSEMLNAGYPKARETEWVGWYFEYIGLPALINAYGGGPRRIGATEFDYARTFVWDLKTHAEPGITSEFEARRPAPLNDRDSMRECISRTGSLGFLVLTGCSVPDDDATFDTWHRRARGSRTPRSSSSRVLKRAFTPVGLTAFVFDGKSSIEDALESKVLTGFQQGRQASGAARKPKLLLHIQRARAAGLDMATTELPLRAA